MTSGAATGTGVISGSGISATGNKFSRLAIKAALISFFKAGSSATFHSSNIPWAIPLRVSKA